MKRLDPDADRELWIWTAMNALTHLLNAALHHAQLTQPVDSFHSQVEGLYCVPDRGSGTLADALHPPGDVMHFGRPPIHGRVPAAIERAGMALRVFEDLRVPYVRGNEAAPVGATEQWRQAYRECVAQLSEVLGNAIGEID